MIKKIIIRAGFSLLVQLLLSLGGSAQSINLDKPLKAGELTLFPDINNENEYYYISDKVQLAKNADGTPQFSFLRYADNSLSGAGQPANTEGDGGGIVHAVVSLAVSPEQLADAKSALQSEKSNAKLIGPVMYKSGKFGIVSSFKDPQGGLIKQVVGLGDAPILDGQKAAISIQLTKQGAKILWESFNTVAPDISFTFEMELKGYRNPKNATIEADFDQIYNHKGFAVGLATTFLAAEIKANFDDLVRSGAIKVKQVGEDEKMEALITTTYNKITDIMFAPMNGTGNLGINELGALTGGSSTSVLDRATNMLSQNRQEARTMNEQDDTRRRTEEDREAARLRDTSRGRASIPDSRVAGGAAPESTPPLSARGAGITDRNTPTASAGSNGAANNTASRQVAMPSFAIVATFEMKQVHQKGIFRIDLNKSTADNVTMPFNENIGNLSAYRDNPNVFRQINLDDPLFRQRELTVLVDGVNAQDFGQYINYVNVRLKKTHQGGDITNEEVRIDRNNFNTAGNNFKMLYGWKGDNDRSKWMNYEYETEWSFFGGKTVKDSLFSSASGAINLVPPFQRRVVEFQADQSTLATQRIRLVTVNLYYKLGATELTKQVTLNPAKAQLSEKVEFLLPGNTYDYEYDVAWRTSDNQLRNSARLKSNESIVFVDQVQ